MSRLGTLPEDVHSHIWSLVHRDYLRDVLPDVVAAVKRQHARLADWGARDLQRLYQRYIQEAYDDAQPIAVEDHRRRLLYHDAVAQGNCDDYTACARRWTEADDEKFMVIRDLPMLLPPSPRSPSSLWI